MDIFLVLVAVSVTALIVGGTAVGVVWGVSSAVARVVQTSGEAASKTVQDSLKAVTGGLEPSVPIEDGIAGQDEPVAPFYPDHEFDPINFPESLDDLRLREAGWGPQTQDTPPQLPPP